MSGGGSGEGGKMGGHGWSGMRVHVPIRDKGSGCSAIEWHVDVALWL